MAFSDASFPTIYDEYFSEPVEPKRSLGSLLGVTKTAEPNQQTRVRQLITQLANSSAYAKMMEQRWREFNPNSAITARLAGIAIDPKARKKFDSELDKMWKKASFGGGRGNAAPLEVVIGGGLHAAIYCAVRVANGNPPPLVIEGSDKVGGVFNCSSKPSFYLNSRNRPGDLSIPGQRNGALNVIPAGPVQPAHLSGDEYQRNSDIAFVIRATLAMNARVMAGRKVVPSIEYIERSGRYVLTLDDDTRIYTSRVVLATGLGREVRPGNDDRILSFLKFMSKMDKDFPLRGIEKVAVIGQGDSGRTAMEALTGQGPSLGASVAALDYPTTIDWYGMDGNAVNRAGWEQCNRSRYKGLARFLPVKVSDESRIRPRVDRAELVSAGYDCVYVNEKPYDLVIGCEGFDDTQTLADGFGEMDIGGRIVAKRVPEEEIYQIGVAAKLPVTALEKTNVPALKALEENSTSMFRYAGRTAALAGTLDRPKPVAQDTKKWKRKGKSLGIDQNGNSLYKGDRVTVKGSVAQPFNSSSEYFEAVVREKQEGGTGNIRVDFANPPSRSWIVVPRLVERLP